MQDFVSPEFSIDPEIYRGSMQQIMAMNLGEYVQCDFLIGTDNILTKSGYLYDVGLKYFVLYNLEPENYVVCDIFNLKFITFAGGFRRERYLKLLPEDIKYQITQLKADRTSKFGMIDNP